MEGSVESQAQSPMQGRSAIAVGKGPPSPCPPVSPHPLILPAPLQVYCCVGALAIAGALYHVHADQLGWWLCERQLPSGGLNGRERERGGGGDIQRRSEWFAPTCRSS